MKIFNFINLRKLFQQFTAIALGFALTAIFALSYANVAQASTHTPSQNSRIDTSKVDRRSEDAPRYLSENEKPKYLDSYMVDRNDSSIEHGRLNDRAVSSDADAGDLGDRINERLERAKDTFETATDAVVNQ
jgi:hypothetical protein